MSRYVEVPESEVPGCAVFTTPPRNQGQIVEVSYSIGTEWAEDADLGAEWQRVEDRSLPPGHRRRVTYYRRVTP